MKKLPEHLNAEIVCGNVASVEDAVKWLEYSFLLVRAIKHPDRYGISTGLEEDDPDLKIRYCTGEEARWLDSGGRGTKDCKRSVNPTLRPATQE